MSGPLGNPATLAPARSPLEEPRWPGRIRELVLELRSGAGGAQRERALSELWVLVNVALQRYVRAHAHRAGRLDAEDVRDIAAEKASDFFRRLDDSEWEATEYAPAQLCTFLRTMARNGLIDHARRREKELA